MKILLITQYFYPDITAGAFRSYDLYKFLRGQGIDVDVVTTYPHRSNVDDVPMEGVFKTRVSALKKKTLPGYMYHFMSFVTKAFFKALKLRGPYDYVLTISPPLPVALLGEIISRLKRSRFILDVGDLWPDTAVAAGKLSEKSILYRVFKMVERYLYRRSDLITCVSEPMKKFILEISSNGNVVVVYSGPLEEEVHEAAMLSSISTGSSKARKKLNLYYTGNIGSLQNIDMLIMAAEKLSRNGFNGIQIKLVGDGVERHRLESYVNEKGIKSVSFLGVRKKQEIAKMIFEDADILYLSLLKDRILEKTIPSKLFDYLMFEMPIIYGIEGEGRELLDGTEACVYFKQDDVDSLCGAIARMVDNYNIYKERCNGLRSIVLNGFTREKNFQKILDEIAPAVVA